MGLTFTVEDCKTPQKLERLFQLVRTELTSIQTGVPASVAQKSTPAAAPASLTQPSGTPGAAGPQGPAGPAGQPVDYASIISGVVAQVTVREDTHAQRVSGSYTPPIGGGFLFYETDRDILYVSNSSAWLYTGGVYASTFANQPAGLTVNDAGFLFYATDQDSMYIWTGAAWDTISRRILLGGFYGIFTHANSADRTYTLPNATGNIVYETAALTNNNFLFGGGGPLVKDSGFSVVPAANGGTGQPVYVVGDLLYASTTTALSRLADAATGNALLAGGAGVAPAYGKVDLTTTVTGVLPAANGGTGVGYNRISDTVALTNQGADISATALANSSTVGTYRASYYLEDTTSDITAGAVTLTIAFTDGAGATTVASVPVALTGAGTLRTSGVFFIQLQSGNITYAVAHTGIFGTAKYALYISLERLS